jgi:hypothetical protein
MLQRFSLSSIAQSIKGTKDTASMEYNKEDIENAISEIKSLGKRAVENQQIAANSQITQTTVQQDIESILKLMKQYENNLYVQRVSCHALSNLSMQVVIARYIVSKNGFQYIRNSLEKFITDHKLCWLASSAIWNMARPPANREIIGKNGVKLMLKVLSIHHTKHEKVTNTAIGALSNLSLCESIKQIICKKQNITLILNVLRLYASSNFKSISVLTSGAGLIANLAVSDEHAETLLQYNALPVLLQLLRWKDNTTEKNNNDENSEESSNDTNSPETTLHRNSCAALNNMVTAKEFINKTLECNGIETIYTFVKNTENNLFTELLTNCLTTIECDIEHPVTTMHLCALYNRIDLLKKLIEKVNNNQDTSAMDIDESSEMSDDSTISVGSHIWGNKTIELYTVNELLNKVDGNNMTVLQYAALGKHYKLVEFLIKCGADSTVLKNNNNLNEESTSETDEMDTKAHKEKINKSIEKATAKIKIITEEHKQAFCDGLPNFPTDLCNLMATFENRIDMLQVAKEFK